MSLCQSAHCHSSIAPGLTPTGNSDKGQSTSRRRAGSWSPEGKNLHLAPQADTFVTRYGPLGDMFSTSRNCRIVAKVWDRTSYPTPGRQSLSPPRQNSAPSESRMKPWSHLRAADPTPGSFVILTQRRKVLAPAS